MSFTATPTDGSTTPIPMSSVVPDGTNTPIALEGGPSLSSGGNTLAPASMYVKDGNDLTQGATTDAAVVGDVSGSLSAKLRGLSKIFNDVWDSVNHHIKVDGSGVTQPVSGTVTANQGGTWTATPGAATSGGSTPYHAISAATTNATSVKASAGNLYGLSISNTNSSARYFKLFDKASSPTLGTDTPKMTIQVPGNSTVIRAFPVGLSFATGIAFAATGAMADSDSTAISAGDLSIDLDYK